MASRSQEEGTTVPIESIQFTSDFPDNIDVARDVLESYSGISPAVVKDHIIRIHDQASQHPDPYPCITNYHFLRFHISQHPLYPDILAQLLAPDSRKTLIDLGTCFGQDLRILARHGAPVTNLFGMEYHQEFIDYGFELFRDRDRLGSNIIAADIFDDNNDEMKRLQGKMDFVSATAFIHLFSWDDQLKACERMISFLRPFNNELEHKQIIFGRQTATVNPGVRIRDNCDWGKKELYLHDEKTFEGLWKEVGKRTGTSWKLTTEMRPWQRDGVKGIEDGENIRLLVFSLERLPHATEEL